MAKKSINDLKFDAHNFNDHTAEGMELLEKSITENGYGRSIVVDKNDNIIAGNGVTEIAKSKNAPIKVIETNGNELVVVKRKDLDINELGGVNMALADNAVSQANLHWNEEELRKAKDAFNLSIEDWNVELPEEIDIDAYLEQTGENVNFSTKGKILIVVPQTYDINEIRAKVQTFFKEQTDIKVK